MGLRHDLWTGSLSRIRSGLFRTDELLLAGPLLAMRPGQLSACLTLLDRKVLDGSLFHDGLLSHLADWLRGRQLSLQDGLLDKED